MSAITKLPNNKNFLSPLGFSFSIKKTPGVNYFVQSVNVPNLTLGSIEYATPFRNIPLPGDKIDYGDLIITFRVDEELKNYLELYNWMVALGKPVSFDQYAQIANVPAASGLGIVSDATLIILSSAKNPIVEVNFTNVFPYALTDLQFNTQMTGVDYIDVIANFKYQAFTVTTLI